ncbi:hypothetical protein [Nonomuraea sp. KM90]
MPVVLASNLGENSVDFGADGVVAALPVVIVFALVQRMSSGAVKR